MKGNPENVSAQAEDRKQERQRGVLEARDGAGMQGVTRQVSCDMAGFREYKAKHGNCAVYCWPYHACSRRTKKWPSGLEHKTP